LRCLLKRLVDPHPAISAMYDIRRLENKVKDQNDP
jgi:hypothetical protein